MNSITPMLAKTYEPGRLTFPCWSQPKLDGIRCLLNNRVGYSRQGNAFSTIPHIQDALEDTFRQLPNLTLDGELYSHTFHDNFNKIVSLVKKQKPTEDELAESKSLLEYWVFDCHVQGWDWTWKERWNFLQSLPLFYKEGPVKLVDTEVINTSWAVDPIYEGMVGANYEGQMLRLDGPYEESGTTNRRSKFLLKRKPTETAEFTVLAIQEGLGKCAGMAGSVLLECDSGHFEASLKFDYAMRKRLWHNAAILRGHQVTVRFQNLTPSGVPRFGRVVAIRDYE